MTEELQSYSSVLQNTCTAGAALAPKNIVSVVKKVNAEDDRSRNVVLFGIEEEERECVKSKVTKILEQLDEKPQILESRRVGRRAHQVQCEKS